MEGEYSKKGEHRKAQVRRVSILRENENEEANARLDGGPNSAPEGGASRETMQHPDIRAQDLCPRSPPDRNASESRMCSMCAARMLTPNGFIRLVPACYPENQVQVRLASSSPDIPTADVGYSVSFMPMKDQDTH